MYRVLFAISRKSFRTSQQRSGVTVYLTLARPIRLISFYFLIGKGLFVSLRYANRVFGPGKNINDKNV